MSSQNTINQNTINQNTINQNRRNRSIFNHNRNFSINLQPFFAILERFLLNYNQILTHLRVNNQNTSLILESELQYIKSNIDRILNLIINITNQQYQINNNNLTSTAQNRFNRQDNFVRRGVGRTDFIQRNNRTNPTLTVTPNNNLTEILRVPLREGSDGGFSGLIQLLNTFSSPVTIAPTQEQIEGATRRIRFEDIQCPRNVICPISLERFTNDQTVSQIRQCGHIFNTTELQTWFRENVRCPVCRYDIRDYRGYNTSEYVAEDTSNIASVFV